MPYSWVRIPTSTSPVLDRCMRGNASRARVCTERIGHGRGVQVREFAWEEGKVGEVALAYLFAPSREELEKAIADLGGEDAVYATEFVEIALRDEEEAC